MHALLHEKTSESVKLEFTILKILMQLPSWVFLMLIQYFSEKHWYAMLPGFPFELLTIFKKALSWSPTIF